MARLLGLPWTGAEDPGLLILGSFPSETSLALGRYYGFGRNHFWGLVGAALAGRGNEAGRDFPEDYDARIARLAEAGIALWDVIASCEREGSLDAAIREEEANDILAFLAARPRIRRVALNGGKAAEAFRRLVAPEIRARALATAARIEWRPPALEGRIFTVCRLPSSSPIPTRDAKRLEDKLEAWTGFLDL